MALRLRIWLAAVAAACALVALSALPPSSFGTSGRAAAGAELPEDVRFRALADEAARTRALLRRVRLMDSVFTRTLVQGERGWGVTVLGAVGPTGPRVAAPLEADFRREVETLPAPPTEPVVLGSWIFPAGRGEPTGSSDPEPDLPRAERAILLARHDGVSHCIGIDGGPTGSVGPADWAFSDPDPDGHRRRNMLGLCWWVGALGHPGPEIERWLAAGAALFANESPARPRPPASGWSYWGAQRRRGPFGLGWQPSPLDACMAGRAEACAQMFRKPTVVGFAQGRTRPGESEAAAVHPGVHWIWWPRFSWMGSWNWLLADLHRDFGHDKVRAFWTSDAQPEEAFLAAFGIPAGDWLASWMRRQTTHVPPGPLPRTRALVWVLAAMGAAATLAVAFASGRRAG